MMPLVTLLFEPRVAVPALLLVSVVGDMRLFPEVRKEFNGRRVASIALPALVCMPAGVAMLAVLDPEITRRVISGVIIVLVALLALGPRIRSNDGLGLLIPAGAASGVLTGLAGIGGPPVVLAFLSLNEPPAQTRANLIAYFGFTGVIAASTMLLSGVAEPKEVLALFAATAPSFLIALHFGAKLFRSGRQASYRKIAFSFLVLVAIVGLVWPG